MLNLWISVRTFLFYDVKSSSPNSCYAFLFLQVYFVFVSNILMFSSVAISHYLLLGFLFLFLIQIRIPYVRIYYLLAVYRYEVFLFSVFISYPDIWNAFIVCNIILVGFSRYGIILSAYLNFRSFPTLYL